MPVHLEGLRKPRRMVARMDSLTAHTRRDVLRLAALADRDGITAAHVAKELGSSRAWTTDVLNELEAQGFLKGTPNRAQRAPGRKPTVFRIQRHKVEAALQELHDWILPEPPDAGDVTPK